MGRSPLTPEDPSTVAVVVLEGQNGILGSESVLPELIEHTEGLVSNLRRLLDAARGAGARVVHCTFAGILGGKDVGTARFWRYLEPAIMDWTPGGSPTQVIPELYDAGDLVLPRHHGLMPSVNSELLPVLNNLGVRTIILTGVSFNMGVLFTAGHAAESGFDVVVPRDAVGGTPAEYREHVLANTIAFIARVTSIDELAAEWAGRADVAHRAGRRI